MSCPEVCLIQPVTLHWVKLAFCFASRDQQGWDSMLSTFLLYWDPILLEPALCVQVLCVLPQSPWVHTCTRPVVPGRQCFLGVIYRLLKHFTTLFSWLSEPCRDDFDKDISLRTGCFKVSHSLYIIHLWVSVNSHTLQEKVSLQMTNEALMYSRM